MPDRTVFFVSDSTGITAETFGNSILNQFSAKARHVRRPFIDSADKAHQVVREINHTGQLEGHRPVVFITMVDAEVLALVKGQCKALVLDLFNTFIEPLEAEFGMTSNHRVGRSADVSKSQEYSDRIEAINFSLAHDDGQSSKNLGEADVILVGVSRSGKTPTTLYLAMQHGIKAANYPLIPEDFERGQLPSSLVTHKRKCFGLTIAADRLHQIRQERRPEPGDARQEPRARRRENASDHPRLHERLELGYAGYFAPGRMPARSVVGVSHLPRGALVNMDFVARR